MVQIVGFFDAPSPQQHSVSHPPPSLLHSFSLTLSKITPQNNNSLTSRCSCVSLGVPSSSQSACVTFSSSAMRAVSCTWLMSCPALAAPPSACSVCLTWTSSELGVEGKNKGFRQEVLSVLSVLEGKWWGCEALHRQLGWWGCVGWLRAARCACVCKERGG